MRLVLTEPRFLKEPVMIISELVNEVVIKADSDKIEIVAMDPANVAMVVFRLLSSSFIEYEVDGEEEIGVNLDNLKQILKRAKPSDTIALETSESKMRVELKGSANRVFNLSLINLDEQKQRIPDLNFSSIIEMPSPLFDDAIEDVSVVADVVSLVAENGRFSIEANGNLSNAKVHFTGEDYAKVTSGDGVSKSNYSLEYLKKIIKGSKLSEKMAVYFSTDYPIKIEYKVIDKLSLSTILAPRVSND
jgi:proliferating cell nuclear antigen